MRRRFGRTRRNKGAGEAKNAPIDAARVFERLAAADIAAAGSFTAIETPDHAASFAVVATAERDGRELVVGFAPNHGGDAALATLAAALRRAAENGFCGDAIAVAPQWSAAARRRLAALRTDALPFSFRAVAESALVEGDGEILPEFDAAAIGLEAAQIAARLIRAVDRDVFQRAAAALTGLAAKHGGAVRGLESTLELVLLARRVAALHAGEDGVRLETLGEERSNQALSAPTLATAMDRLEGSLRKHLNDRRLKDGEEGLRAQLAAPLAEIAGVRHAKLWPMGGFDAEVVDFLGVHDDGRPVVGAIRESLGLPALGQILDAAVVLRPALPVLLAHAGPPLRIESPRLVLAAKTFEDAALRVLASLALDHVAFDIELRRGRDPVLALRGSTAGSGFLAEMTARPARPARPVVSAGSAGAAGSAEAASPAEPGPDGGRPRSRGRRGGRRSQAGEAAPAAGPVQATASNFDEISLFDLADDPRAVDDAGDDGRRPRRGRGRRRRTGRPEGENDAGAVSGARATLDDADGEADRDPELVAGPELEGSSGRSRGRRRGRRAGAAAGPAEEPPDSEPEVSGDDSGDDLDSEADADDLAEGLAPLDEIPDLGEIPQPAYDDEEDEDDDGENDRARRRREAELRALAAGLEDQTREPEEQQSRLPRKRAAIVVHADRLSVLSGVLLARDLRQIEGLWVYGQADLMTFFRGVATDLPDDTPIYVVGFTASPARDAIATAALYRGRLAWFDHHEWPPEDLGAMADTIGREHLHVAAGAESSLSEILSVRERRSRFSDKIVELATGNFSQHDYERWGRVWWQRLADIAKRSGDRRADLDALLAGRASDLATEAGRISLPPEPAEVAYVSERDFRLVHFHGVTLVVVPVPAELDLHLTARVARERFDAAVSVAYCEGGDLVVLGGDEGRGRRGLDLTSMVSHLATKHAWVIPLPDDDHVARLRIRDLGHHPGRFDELISEIAMGRSILEG